MSMITYGRKRAYPSTTGASKLARSSRKPARKSRSAYRFFAPASVQTKTGFPGFMKITHRYSSAIRLTTLAGATGSYIFSCNGIYDPDVSGTGHQPMYHDTYEKIYNDYTVLGAKIVAHFWSEENTSYAYSIVGIKLDDDASLSPATTIESIVEQPSKLVKWKYLHSTAQAVENVKTVVKKFSAKKFFGVKDMADNNNKLGANMGANPDDAANFILFAGHPTSLIDIPAIKYDVTIDYIVKFHELKDMEQS